MAGTLEILLVRIRDGQASEADVAQARALAAHDARLPEDIRSEVLTVPDDVAADTEALLALLGHDDGLGEMLRSAVLQEANLADQVMEALGEFAVPLADAVRDEAGTVEVSLDALHELEAHVLPVAEAVRFEAGKVDVSVAVMAQLGVSEWMPVAAAIRDEAGTVDVSGAVMQSLGGEVLGLREAVVNEAGAVDLSDAVMAGLAGPMAMPGPTAAPELPAPANTARWSMGALLMAAMALLVLGAGGLMNGFGTVEVPIGNEDGGRVALLTDSDMVFASAADVVVEDLSYGANVVVFQAEGDAGAMILWVDEEVL